MIRQMEKLRKMKISKYSRMFDLVDDAMLCESLLTEEERRKMDDGLMHDFFLGILKEAINNEAAVGQLIWAIKDSKINVNYYFDDGLTALHLAAKLGNQTCVVVLLESGADPNALDLRNGISPLHYCAMSKNWKSIQNLIKAGADAAYINVTSGNLRSAFHYAAESGSPETLAELLVIEDINPLKRHEMKKTLTGLLDLQDSDGHTPLHLACIDGNVDSVRILLQAGAQPGTEDCDGRNSKELAKQAGKEEIIKTIDDFTNGNLKTKLADLVSSPTRKPKTPGTSLTPYSASKAPVVDVSKIKPQKTVDLTKAKEFWVVVVAGHLFLRVPRRLKKLQEDQGSESKYDLRRVILFESREEAEKAVRKWVLEEIKNQLEPKKDKKITLKRGNSEGLIPTGFRHRLKKAFSRESITTKTAPDMKNPPITPSAMIKNHSMSRLDNIDNNSNPASSRSTSPLALAGSTFRWGPGGIRQDSTNSIVSTITASSTAEINQQNKSITQSPEPTPQNQIFVVHGVKVEGSVLGAVNNPTQTREAAPTECSSTNSIDSENELQQEEKRFQILKDKIEPSILAYQTAKIIIHKVGSLKAQLPCYFEAAPIKTLTVNEKGPPEGNIMKTEDEELKTSKSVDDGEDPMLSAYKRSQIPSDTPMERSRKEVLQDKIFYVQTEIMELKRRLAELEQQEHSSKEDSKLNSEHLLNLDNI